MELSKNFKIYLEIMYCNLRLTFYIHIDTIYLDTRAVLLCLFLDKISNN